MQNTKQKIPKGAPQYFHAKKAFLSFFYPQNKSDLATSKWLNRYKQNYTN